MRNNSYNCSSHQQPACPHWRMGSCADKPMPNERTTSEVARDIGVAPDVLRKWKYRGLLKLAPQGVSGQGRSVECVWSKEAFEEAKAHAENPNIINRHRNPPDSSGVRALKGEP